MIAQQTTMKRKSGKLILVISWLVIKTQQYAYAERIHVLCRAHIAVFSNYSQHSYKYSQNPGQKWVHIFVNQSSEEPYVITILLAIGMNISCPRKYNKRFL